MHVGRTYPAGPVPTSVVSETALSFFGREPPKTTPTAPSSPPRQVAEAIRQTPKIIRHIRERRMRQDLSIYLVARRAVVPRDAASGVTRVQRLQAASPAMSVCRPPYRSASHPPKVYREGPFRERHEERKQGERGAGGGGEVEIISRDGHLSVHHLALSSKNRPCHMIHSVVGTQGP